MLYFVEPQIFLMYCSYKYTFFRVFFSLSHLALFQAQLFHASLLTSILRDSFLRMKDTKKWLWHACTVKSYLLGGEIHTSYMYLHFGKENKSGWWSQVKIQSCVWYLSSNFYLPGSNHLQQKIHFCFFGRKEVCISSL